ncbi:MAG: quinolinate synthase NadA [Acutalibacteraceae bacterium]
MHQDIILPCTRCHERISRERVGASGVQSDVVALADYAGSTLGILEYATKSDAQEFIVCTETESSQFAKANPTKFYAVKKHQVCDDMKKLH